MLFHGVIICVHSFITFQETETFFHFFPLQDHAVPTTPTAKTAPVSVGSDVEPSTRWLFWILVFVIHSNIVTMKWQCFHREGKAMLKLHYSENQLSTKNAYEKQSPLYRQTTTYLPTYLPISPHHASLPCVRPPHFPANLLYPSDKLLIDPTTLTPPLLSPQI